jgi:hypothetical protein
VRPLADPETRKQRLLAGLAPLFCIAGFFATPANPVGSTLAPFLLFLFLRRRDYPTATSHALRTADFAFSMNIYWLLAQYGVHALGLIGGSFTPGPNLLLRLGFLLFAYFMAMLVVDFVQGLRGREFKYPLSFRMAERIFVAMERRDEKARGKAD